MEKNINNRILYLDILKVFAALSVINLHISATNIILSFNTVSLKYWWIENIFDSISRWSVPIFIMISGTLLLNPTKNENIDYFLKKRCIKIVIPFLIWGIIYIIWGARSDFNILSIKYILDQYIKGSIFWHMWYIYMIMALYFMTPIIRVYIKNAEDSNMKYLLLLLFISASVFQLLEKIINIQINDYFKLQPMLGFLGYYILGYFLNKIYIPKNIRKYIYGLAICSIVLIPLGTYIFTKNNKGNIDYSLYEYTNPLIVFISIAMFLLFKHTNWNKFFMNKQKILKIILSISSSSFGIYLIHPLVMGILILTNFQVFNENCNPLIRIPIMDFIVFIISYFIILLMKKLSYIKYMVP